jgi:hypothetical protein
VKNLARLALLLALVVGSAILASAQGVSAEKKNQSPSGGPDTFTSLDGRFTVGLPQRISGFSPITFDTPKGRVTAGDTIKWELEGARFDIGYMDTPSPAASAEDAKARLRKGADAMLASEIDSGGTLVSRSDISLAGNVGHEVKVEFPEFYVVTRLYSVGQRVYQVTAVFKKDAQSQESALKVLDSFRPLVTPADMEAAKEKKIADATPELLPQEPAVKKLKSDAEDAGLKGRVKSEAHENVYFKEVGGALTEGESKSGGKAYYDERGNVTRTVTYWDGNPSDVTVYGYLDGNRVSHVGTVYYEHDIAVAIPFGDAAAARPKFDPRYSYRYAYKYDDKGRLTEEDRYLSNGELAERYVRVYSGDQMQRLTYIAGDSLSKKSVETLDAQGRSVDEADYDVKTGAVKEKYSRTYDSFDAQGNWTKLTTYKWAEKDGKGQFVPDHVTYRTITYY